MLTAQDRQGNTRLAREATKHDGPFTCPECTNTVVLRKGYIKTHHFAHKPPVQCDYGSGETELHHRAKQAISDGLQTHPGVYDVRVEHRFPGVRADVFFQIRHCSIAVEVQRSTMPVPKIIERIRCYSHAGVAVVWVVPFAPPERNEFSRIPSWVQFLHMLTFGRVYYWQEGISVLPVHFGDRWSRYSVSFGTKTKKAAVYGPMLHLVDDFTRVWRKQFAGGDFVAPACSIWQDNLSVWWKDAMNDHIAHAMERAQ